MADHITFDIAVRDRLNSALDKAGKKVTHLDKKFDKLGDQLPSKMDKFGKKTNRAMSKSGKAMHGMFDGLESRMGGLSSMAPMLSNPYVAAGAAVAAVTAGAAIGLGKATIAAGNFNHVFLELANLNLDKPNSEIQRLKDNVLDMSLDTGKSAAVISQAYFDVQSATGMYGREVDQVVKKVAVFSKATKTDMNTAIAGAVKGIKNYGLGVNELD
ncbi:MAG: hypothetical protein ACPG5P_03875, partial [Saprospiraceae bacterium]